MNLREIVYGIKRERCFTDATTIGGIIFPLIKINHYDVYVYGGGADISSVILYFWNFGIEVKGIIDSDLQKDGKLILDKVSIIHPCNIMKKFNSEKTIAIINTIYFTGLEQNEIVNILFELGITKFYALNDDEKEIMKVHSTPWRDSGRIDYYREHIGELEDTYNSLYDMESRDIMLEYIRVYMQFGTYSLRQCDSMVKYFWGGKTDEKYEEIYEHLENEVWINCGSCNGDNIFWYFANGFMAKRIFAYEADSKTYEVLCKNLEYLPDKYKNRVTTVNSFIDSETDFKEVIGEEKITLINADIEGGELDLLKSMSDIIRKDRPVLALCAYHKASDLTELPHYIRTIVEDYDLVLRKYESGIWSIGRTSELVLYAIPRERNKVIK